MEWNGMEWFPDKLNFNFRLDQVKSAPWVTEIEKISERLINNIVEILPYLPHSPGFGQ